MRRCDLRRLGAAIVGVLATLAAAGGALAPGASAQASERERAVSPLLAKELAVLTDQGISSSGAMQAIEAQGAIAHADVNRGLESALGSAYGGVWFEPASAKLHVGVTSQAAVQTANTVAQAAGVAANVTATPVRFSMAQLLAAQRRWNRRLAALFAREEVTTGIQPDHNAVAVNLSSTVPASERGALEREASADAVNVTIALAGAPLTTRAEAKECNIFPFADCNPSITPGVEIWSKPTCNLVGNFMGRKFFPTKEQCENRKMFRRGVEGEWERTSAECTAGPVAIPEANRTRRVLLTAGHCIAKAGGEGSEWFAFKRNLEEPLVGKAGKFENGGLEEEKKGDFGEIPIEAGWRTGKANNPVLAVTAEWKKEEETRYKVKGLREPIVSTINCHEGSTSGEWCGKIKTVNLTVTYGGNTKEGLVEEEKAISEGGDSGGPWLFVEANNEVLMEGIHVAKKDPAECKENAVSKEGAEYFATQAECLNYKEFREGTEGKWERKLKTYWQPLIKPAAGTTSGVLEKLELELLTTANEFIPRPAAWHVKGAELTGTKGATGTNEGAFTLKASSLITIECKAATGKGSIIATRTGEAQIKFTECSVQGKTSEECHVSTPGEPVGTLNTKAASTELVYLGSEKAAREGAALGMLISPKEGATLLIVTVAGTKCPPFTTGEKKVEGTVAVEVSPSGAEAKSLKLIAPSSAIKSAYKSKAEGELEEVKPSLTAFGVGVTLAGTSKLELESKEEFGAFES